MNKNRHVCLLILLCLAGCGGGGTPAPATAPAQGSYIASPGGKVLTVTASGEILGFIHGRVNPDWSVQGTGGPGWLIPLIGGGYELELQSATYILERRP